MSLWTVNRENPQGFAPNSYFEKTDDGFQKVEVNFQNNRIKIMKAFGIIYPSTEVQQYMLRIGAQRFVRERSVIIGG